MQRRQRGIGFIGTLFVLVLIVIIAIFGMKTVPVVIEYFTIKKVIASMERSGDLRSGNALEIRQSFDRRATIDHIVSIEGRDLIISREGNGVVVQFAYEKRVPLFGPVSLLFELKGSSAPGGAGGG